METRFEVGDKVRSNTKHQGLQEGAVYEIVRVDARSMGFFGTFVTYTVARIWDGAREEIEVTNGHLLLSPISD